jgi:hypothetical protein
MKPPNIRQQLVYKGLLLLQTRNLFSQYNTRTPVLETSV